MGTALPGATKGIIINNMPGSPGMLSAGKVSRGLKGPPAEHKVMPYKALQK